jgi:signal peptide peptidase SppA
MSKRINQAFFMRPWAVERKTFDVMTEVFERFSRGEKLSVEEIQLKVGDKKKTSPDFEIIGDTAFIPIYGVIAKRSSMVNNISQPSGTSIEEIRKDFRHALASKEVSRIVLDIDSPGGSVDGVAEMAELIFESRGAKPVIAYADGMMASAAYWIGSAADAVYASKSSDVGSIGVYATLFDYSVAYHNAGIKPEIIKAGRNKATGHPLKPLTEDDRAVVQEEVNDIYDMFVESVARQRGMSLEAALSVATGRVYIAGRGLKLKLIDGIQSVDAEKERAAGTVSAKKSVVMTGNEAATPDNTAPDNPDAAGTNTKEEAQDMDLKTITKEDLKAGRPDLHDAIYAEGKGAGAEEAKKEAEKSAETIKATATEEGRKAGAVAERARIAGIREAARVIPGCDALAEEAISSGISADEALKKFKDARLSAMQSSSPASPGPSEDTQTSAPAATDETLEEQCKKQWEKDASLRNEFASLETYTGFRRAQAKGRIRSGRDWRQKPGHAAV